MTNLKKHVSAGPEPTWKRTAFYDEKTGAVLLPVSIFGLSPQDAYMRCRYSGVQVIDHDGHVYASHDWLMRDNRYREQIEARVKEILENEGNHGEEQS